MEAAIDVDDASGREIQAAFGDRADGLGDVAGLAPAPDRGQALGDQPSYFSLTTRVMSVSMMPGLISKTPMSYSASRSA